MSASERERLRRAQPALESEACPERVAGGKDAAQARQGRWVGWLVEGISASAPELGYNYEYLNSRYESRKDSRFHHLPPLWLWRSLPSLHFLLPASGHASVQVHLLGPSRLYEIEHSHYTTTVKAPRYCSIYLLVNPH